MSTAKRGKRADKRRRKKRIVRYIKRTLLCLATALILIVGGLYAVMALLCYGPSPTAGDLFVTSVMETSALKFLANVYFTGDEIEDILERNSVVSYEEETDTSLVVYVPPAPKPVDDDTAPQDEVEEDPVVELVDITGGSYTGYMMIIKDPSRVTLGLSVNSFSGRGAGKTLQQIVEHYEAIAGVNGGAFVDPNGSGNGGTPDGVVISNGKVLWNKIESSTNCTTLIGLTYDNKLYISNKVNAKRALENGVRDAVTFGPALVINGEPVSLKGRSSGMNPRTCIGQRADGALLLVMVNGRKANSLGATLSDLVDLMMDCGAVNAANLDGGSSSGIVYDGEYLNLPPTATGMRRIPTSFIVK